MVHQLVSSSATVGMLWEYWVNAIDADAPATKGAS